MHSAPRRGRLVLAAWLAASAAAWLTGCGAMLDTVGSVPTERTAKAQLDAHVYALRGMIGVVFSTGMNELAGELNSRGLRTTVHEREWQPTAEAAIAEYKENGGRTRILLVGHSDGADAIIAMSQRLQEEGIPVALAVTFDPTRLAHKVPANVERFVNLYSSANILGGGSIAAAADFHGHFSNVNLREHIEIGHVTIEKSRLLHEAVIPKFLQAAAFGNAPVGDAVALDYTVPEDARIEVWDDGIAVQVQPGDTVAALAARYGVPPWSIRRINKLGDSEIADGQSIVIPRYLSPASAVASLAGPPPATR